MGDGRMHQPPGALCLPAQGCAQARNIEGCGIVTGAIPQALSIGATKPGSPVVDLGAVLWGGVRVGSFPAARTHMRGVARLLPLQTNSGKKTLVAQDSPQGSPDLGVVAP